MSVPATPATREQWLRLGALMRERRHELDEMTMEEACSASGGRLKKSVWGDIENAKRVSFSDKALRGVEHALEWESGSVTDILEGGEPTPLPASDDDLRKRVERLEGALEEILRRLPSVQESR